MSRLCSSLGWNNGFIKNEKWEKVGKVKSKERAQRKEGRCGTGGRGLSPLGLVNSRRAKLSLEQIHTTLQTDSQEAFVK